MIRLLLLLTLSMCIPRQVAPPDARWGFYDDKAAARLKAYDRVDAADLARVRKEISEKCDIAKAEKREFLGLPAFVLNGFDAEHKPGTVCNWNLNRELIYYGRGSDGSAREFETTWFLGALRSIVVTFPDKRIQVYRAWSYTRSATEWDAKLVHVEIRNLAKGKTVRYMFNRVDGGLLERAEFYGREPRIQLDGLFFTAALKRGEPNCLIYHGNKSPEILSGPSCVISDIPDLSLTRL